MHFALPGKFGDKTYQLVRLRRCCIEQNNECDDECIIEPTREASTREAMWLNKLPSAKKRQRAHCLLRACDLCVCVATLLLCYGIASRK